MKQVNTPLTAKDWLASKPHLLGPFLRIPRAEIVEILGMSGFDFVIADLEHGPITINEIYPLILAAENHGIRLLARLPGIQESYIKWLLDLGIGGLQIPHIRTADDVRRVVQYARFAPEGERGLCRFVRAAEFSNIPKEQYLVEQNRKPVLVFQVEGKEGVENINEIIRVPGIDVLFIGPYDLSQSLGMPGQIWREEVTNEVAKVIHACQQAGIAVGVFTDTPDGVQHWAKMGVKYINYRIEAEFILTSFKTHVAELKSSL